MSVARAWWLVAAIACREAPAPVRPVEAPTPSVDPVQDAARAAESAARMARVAWQARVNQAWRDEGVQAAVRACRDEVPMILDKIAADQGVYVGRAAPRAHPGSGPDWVVDAVKAASPGDPARQGDRMRVVLPMAGQPGCRACHGPASSLRRDVRDALEAEGVTQEAVVGVGGVVWTQAPIAGP